MAKGLLSGRKLPKGVCFHPTISRCILIEQRPTFVDIFIFNFFGSLADPELPTRAAAYSSDLPAVSASPPYFLVWWFMFSCRIVSQKLSHEFKGPIKISSSFSHQVELTSGREGERKVVER